MLKVENGKLKVSIKNIMASNIFWLLIVLCIFYCITHYVIPCSPVYKVNDIYFQVKTRLGNKYGSKVVAMAANKHLNNCTLVGKQFITDEYFYTYRTMDELKNECVYIEFSTLNYKHIKDIKNILNGRIKVN